jgi:hypothetical protein
VKGRAAHANPLVTCHAKQALRSAVHNRYLNRSFTNDAVVAARSLNLVTETDP